MCVIDGVSSSEDGRPPSLRLKWPNTGTYYRLWHVGGILFPERCESISVTSSLFTPPEIRPCINKYDSPTPETICDGFDCERHQYWMEPDQCQNETAFNWTSADRKLVLAPYEKGFGASSGWIYNGSRDCLAQRIFCRIFLACILSGVRECYAPDCLARMRQLETTAPDCKWQPFLRFVLTVASCGAFSVLNLLKAHFDIEAASYPTSALGLDPRKIPQDLCVDIHQVYDVWNWALRNSKRSFGWGYDRSHRPSEFNRRISKDVALPSFLVPGYQARALEVSSQCQMMYGICPSRVWNIATQGSNGLPNMFHIVNTIHSALKDRGPGKHTDCTDETCVFSNTNSTLKQQAHKCEKGSCQDELAFSSDLLNKAADADMGGDRILAWSSRASTIPRLDDSYDSHVAISHVWSDGTGEGMKPDRRVNRCLFDYFARQVNNLGCNAIWWDAISIPTERHLRDAAIKKMLSNFEKAKVTLVHDQELTRFTWRDDGSPAAAIVLSSWFTRGWTAAELFASRNHPVKFIFAGPSGRPVLKDLDGDILAKPSIFNAPQTLGHVAASDMIRSLRPKVSRNPSVDDSEDSEYERFRFHYPRRPLAQMVLRVSSLESLLSILQPRTTSWARDRMVIAGLLCLPPGEVDLEMQGETGLQLRMTQTLLAKFSEIPLMYLIHDHTTLSKNGPWSWCPRDIFDLGRFTNASESKDLNACRVYPDGRLACNFDIYEVESSDTIIPLGQHPALVARVTKALLQRQKCLLLTNSDLLERNMPLFLLAQPVQVYSSRVIGCHWIAWVYLHNRRGLGIRREHGSASSRVIRRRCIQHVGDLSRSSSSVPTTQVLFGDHSLSEHSPLGFDLVSLVVDRLEKSRMSNHIPRTRDLGMADNTRRFWNFNDSSNLREEGTQKVSALDVLLNEKSTWPPQPVYLDKIDATSHRFISRFQKPSPYIAIMMFHAKMEENQITTTFLQTLWKGIDIEPCDATHDYHCHGLISLSWTYPYHMKSSECGKPNPTVLRSEFHIIDDLGVSEEAVPINLSLGHQSLEKSIAPLSKMSKTGAISFRSVRSCRKCRSCKLNGKSKDPDWVIEYLKENSNLGY